MTAESMRMRIDTIAGGSLDDTPHESSHPATAVENGVFYSLLMLQTRGWLCNSWTERFVVLADGQLHLYASADADAPLVTRAISACTGIVTEIDDCRTGEYCFSLRIAMCDGSRDSAGYLLTLCARSSKEQQLWLQALANGGVRYEEDDSLFDLNARDL
ncbi:hypothetical protein EMIHUDRAFT_437439, partial [Emiliania huxleyi CCMP1516]|uniref:PH domain-containing protein n=2 Tax=Emiliania huxleyi TaxID=2903 RepID=A0A0D3ILN9_EMIH1